MRQAVIVSYARTGLTKAGRGGFNNTSSMTMLGHNPMRQQDRQDRPYGQHDDATDDLG